MDLIKLVGCTVTETVHVEHNCLLAFLAEGGINCTFMRSSMLSACVFFSVLPLHL